MAWEPIGRDDFITLSTAEADEAANTLHREHIRIATGLLLPIWSLLKGSSSVRRVAAADGRSWLGRIVHDSDGAACPREGGESADLTGTASIHATLLAVIC
ncbi:hypothetical protein FHS96_005893 [Sphingomonas zeicaulis]|uniref:hypothetical protein n=1 Tax=Sphingomonas zeicaulis TaxID=1632740 RepID=UPI003D1FF040